MTTEPSAPAARAGADRPLVIALVDDNPDIRETMSELLSSWGHRVEVAGDGLAGVELIARCQPDLAIVDIGLPKLDGYGVATEVRKRLGKGQIRLVAVSGFGQEADRKRSLEVGFDDHLVKPVDVDVDPQPAGRGRADPAVLTRAAPRRVTGARCLSCAFVSTPVPDWAAAGGA